MDLCVFDRFFIDPDSLRENILSKPFGEYVGYAGEVYSGIQERPAEEFEEQLGHSVGFRVKVLKAAARINFAGEEPNAAIHPDIDYGEFACVGYLTPSNAPFTATAFWKHREFGLDEMPDAAWLERRGLSEEAFIKRIVGDSNNQDAWKLDTIVGAKPGRLIAYPTSRFHSRFPFAAFGATPEEARIIYVAFFDRA